MDAEFPPDSHVNVVNGSEIRNASAGLPREDAFVSFCEF
jgi:hypothetical protein